VQQDSAMCTTINVKVCGQEQTLLKTNVDGVEFELNCLSSRNNSIDQHIEAVSPFINIKRNRKENGVTCYSYWGALIIILTQNKCLPLT
jgi:hypothetical protein